MPAQYDAIAEQYKRSKRVSWRYHIEQHSLFKLVGDLTGKSVLDLACGEGHYTRLIKALGASRVVGVDVSPKMIDLAAATERERRQGIEYIVADAREIDFAAPFDVVVAAYLLNYARTEDELRAMGQAICRSLKAGGRFVSVNNNPAQSFSQFGSTRKYGFIKSAAKEPHNGTPIHYTFFMDHETFQIENYHLDAATHERIFRETGFSNVEWRKVELSPSEASGPDQHFWREFFVDPPVILLHCSKVTAAESASV
jgi:ubiquinone/menaquinone biosynthesis C-methylase UbiE